MAFVGVLFLFHSLALLVGVMSSLVPVVIQGALLWLIVKARLLVQIWCAVLAVAGLYGVVSRLLASEANGIATRKESMVGGVCRLLPYLCEPVHERKGGRFTFMYCPASSSSDGWTQ